MGSSQIDSAMFTYEDFANYLRGEGVPDLKLRDSFLGAWMPD